MTGLRASLARRLAQLARPRAAEVLPVQLDRRRVYVLPTGFGLFYAALVLAMALGALNYNNNPALLMALLLGATAMSSLIFAHLQLSGLRMDAVSADPVHAGESLMLHIALSARDGRLRRGLRLDGAETAAFAPAMSAEGTVVELGLPTQRRGWHDIGRLRVSTTQPLGLARAWSWIWPPPLLVYPALEVHGPPLPEGDAPASARSSTRPATMSITCAVIARAMPRARSHGSRPRGATCCWCENTNSLSGWRSGWSGTRWAPLRTKTGFDASRIGWSSANAKDDAIGSRSRANRPPGPANGALHRHLCLRALALMPYADR